MMELRAEADYQAYAYLASKGLYLVAGITRDSVPSLTEISQQEGPLEYCPNDIEKRWADEQMAEQQLAKDGGRAGFLLESIDTGDVAAFGWVGKSSEDERKFLPMCENTFALRVNENYRGQRLATPASRLIVRAAMSLYGARRIGLETWGSNTAAVRSYLGAGALLVTTQADKRKTRAPELQDTEGKVRDVRLYMRFPQSA
jgi:RimJ/RimL family protein N-acetyltransferase